MKNVSVKDLKILEAIKLDCSTATKEELAAAYLVLNDLSLRVQKQFNNVNLTLTAIKEKERQMSMFEDETFANSFGEIAITEVEIPVHSLNRKGLLEHVGCPTTSTKYGDYVYSAPTVQEKKLFKAYEDGRLDSETAAYIKTTTFKQSQFDFNGKKEEK